MNNRILTGVLALTACAAGMPSAFAQNYPPPPGYSQPLRPVSSDPGRPSGVNPDFDSLDDESDAGQSRAAGTLSPPGFQQPGPPQAGYGQAIPQGPILSPDDPRYGRPPVQASVPQGPILSPDDPRYGRPPGAPPLVYSDRASAPGNDGYRPPGAIDGQTGTASPRPQFDSQGRTVAVLPPDDQPETGPRQELPPRLRRQEVDYVTKEPAGTIIVDTPNTQLYYILGHGRAIRYGVRVGRDGFTWTGVQKITRKAEWPDWHPPPEMIERQPYLPRFMAGGDGNPLGARAMYLGSTVYRIHGTNQPSTIGKFVSSGCIGMLNEDVEDLFDRAKVGTRVVVLPGGPPPAAVTASAQPADGAGYGPSASAVVGAPGQGPTAVPPLPTPVTVR
ncbi:MAG: L,D-transpeptidase [Xanthobacteraceae bacterium]|nr:L,D-transpeptidase [Xanthobacteraceae bacterium]